MIWEGIHAQSPIGIVIAARELGKSDFLSVGHDFSMRKNVGKKWVCLLKSVGKVESNEVFCGAVEEEEGGEKLVKMDEELTNREEAIEEELEAGEVFVLRRYFSRYFKVPTCSTLTYLYTCTCQSDRSDRSDPMTPAMTAMTRPLWPL
ncbi:hypothetical protein L249_7367 [Ophiocordyceps polyrhachis-furcata BCC 54312]|uniref:Uncharacterized protein n=1 Tax=Ophiocordyceps polyrhachis-furcata BCC 54312 TaxID=1330021 RepID=A0A367L9S0_9HYPO|nr:hypothetical protein L249_7367 [Ophiocordyceps polyrhachis-furcata BCC 54312]